MVFKAQDPGCLLVSMCRAHILTFRMTAKLVVRSFVSIIEKLPPTSFGKIFGQGLACMYSPERHFRATDLNITK
jgi:hypothetical protein